ncbi:hypothetical protein ACFWB1_21840 [Streptomyces goshikiensis]|uniref:hypothetical protein n=1 Tax=Streptomyces goshikiensis TaxID=1942 RepID=UPI0036852AF9
MLPFHLDACSLRQDQHRGNEPLARAATWLAPISDLMPRVLAADFTQAVISRDWMIQSFLPGTPPPELLGSYQKETHGAFREAATLVSPS